MKGLSLSFAIALAVAGVASAQTSSNAARSLAATCANCHGTNGVSQGDLPSLAGQPKNDIVRAMREYKSGTRSATVMHQLAKGYTDDQIEALAAWFAAQKPAK